jgi:uncharacterized sulfatase
MIRWIRLVPLLAMTAGALAAAPARPNIVLIVSDDHAWTDYGFMGHPQIRTPRLDRLAAESRVFPRGYVPSSLCCPSLASILTGRYPHEHRIANNDPPLPPELKGAAKYRSPEFRAGRERMNRFMDAQPTLPRLLAQAGYLSLQTGKWWQGHYRRGGFTHGMTLDESATGGGRHGDDGLKIGRQTMQPVHDFLDEATRAGKPFFVWYAPMMPHDPHTPPERLLAKYRDRTNSLHVARYWAMVEWFDETCGQLLDALEQRGLSTNTIVAYVTDNGWIQSPDNPRYAPRSKQSPYDGGLRTPILVRWPGRVKPGRVETPVSSIDLAPTLLRAAAVELPAGLPGVNLLDARAVAARDAVFGACFTHDAVDLDQPASSLRWRWCVSGDWKLISPNPALTTNGVVELFNLARDPHEERNLASTEARRVKRMARRLDNWWQPAPASR